MLPLHRLYSTCRSSGYGGVAHSHGDLRCMLFALVRFQLLSWMSLLPYMVVTFHHSAWWRMGPFLHGPLWLVLTVYWFELWLFPISCGVSSLPIVNSVDLLCWTPGVVRALASITVWSGTVCGPCFISCDWFLRSTSSSGTVSNYWPAIFLGPIP